ncbi:MAG: hypothetical protein M0R80_26120 [Proteobacteria bacterium]|jgi:hypothetical protein|nr:hypothetical protein [Pseudomonadota bacterium]
MRTRIKEYSDVHGKGAAAKRFGVSVQFVYGLFKDKGFVAEKISAPTVPAKFSEEYILGIGKSACNVQSLQPGELLAIISTMPSICHELVELRRLVARLKRNPSEIEKMVVVVKARENAQKAVKRRGGWNAKEW